MEGAAVMGVPTETTGDEFRERREHIGNDREVEVCEEDSVSDECFYQLAYCVQELLVA